MKISAYRALSNGMFKAAKEAREASRSGDGDAVAPPRAREMPGVDEEKAAFADNLT